MPNDAKLGLIVGVAIVLVIAVVFFHKDPRATATAAQVPAAAASVPGAAPVVPSAEIDRGVRS